MNLQDQPNPQAEAQKLWDQIDAEDNGTAVPPPREPVAAPAEDNPAVSAAPADKADAPAPTDEPLSAREQLLMDKLSGLESNFNQVQQRLRTAEGHIGGLNNQLTRQQQAAKQVTANGGDAPSAQEVRQAQGDPEAMKALKKDYPEFATAMDAVLSEKIAELEQRLGQSRQPDQAPAGVSAEEVAEIRQSLMVEIKHPGWEDRVRTPEFAGWLTRQPREVQLLAASASPQDAVRLLDLHQAGTTAAPNPAAEQKNQRLNSAAAIPSGRQGAQVRAKAVEEMTKEEYWRYLDETDREKNRNKG